VFIGVRYFLSRGRSERAGECGARLLGGDLGAAGQSVRTSELVVPATLLGLSSPGAHLHAGDVLVEKEHGGLFWS